ncbi:carbohydrate kinase family protein [Georgenia sp. SYP-B2076]|uniref:carbohydrate kinase family protein n=1 Tax=Georgenia sp. SYP-B2076 TaxID=2495881 RepID=UPI000F8C7BCA|nr:PfkB family carbohydrate kinase [Georgenia sp. SYP-B2076]
MGRVVHVIGNIQLDVLAGPVTALPRPGGDDVVERIAVRPAGAAGNVSLALAGLGVRHRLFGAVGDDQAGRWVAAELRRAGVGADLQVVHGQETGISIALEAPGRERAFLTAHGVLTNYGEGDVPVQACEADLVLLTGYFSIPGLRGEATAHLLQRARKHGAVTLFDTGWDPDDWQGGAVREVLELLPLVDIFLPNEPEALALTGEDDVERALATLVDRCGGWVVVKRGERGAVALGPPGDVVRISAPPVAALDSTGAGDSLAAGVLADLAEGASLPAALTTGVRLASTVVGRGSLDRYPGRDDLLAAVEADDDRVG